jgi:SAM-dependent methyltransferase
MIGGLSENVWNALACPECGFSLQREERGAVCPGCGAKFPLAESGTLDLRLARPKKHTLEFELGSKAPAEGDCPAGLLECNPAPGVDFSNLAIPRHMSKTLLSHFPRARTRNSLMLDLGCGKGIHRAVCERAGFEWVGLDYDSPQASILGDAHAIPFRDRTFEFLLSVAVLEHVRNPFVMMREAFRVLKTGGVFLGTVAFLEPFHGGSLYHHTHLGVWNSLSCGGFRVKRIAPDEHWTVLEAQAGTGLFPRMPTAAAQAILLPVRLLHRLWWRIGFAAAGRGGELTRLLRTAGAFTFIAVRET